MFRLIRLLAIIAVITACSMDLARDVFATQKAARNQHAGATLNLNRLPESPMNFALIASDGDESVVTTTFDEDRLQLVHEIMVAAKTFAFTDDGVGTTEAITTRFSDPNENALIVDVLKFGNSSSLFVTVHTENGSMTIEAGAVSRSDKKASGPFFEVLGRLDSVLRPKATTK